MRALIDSKNFKIGFIGNDFIGVGIIFSGFGADSVFKGFNFTTERGDIIGESGI